MRNVSDFYLLDSAFNVFDQLFFAPTGSDTQDQVGGFLVSKKTDKEISFSKALPGLTKDELKVSILDKGVKIEVLPKKDNVWQDKATYVIRPTKVDLNTLKVSYVSGVLTLLFSLDTNSPYFSRDIPVEFS